MARSMTVRCDKSRASTNQPTSGRMLRTMNFGVSTTVELSLLGLLAAAAGGLALASGDYAFSLIFMTMSLVASLTSFEGANDNLAGPEVASWGGVPRAPYGPSKGVEMSGRLRGPHGSTCDWLPVG
jgi:hypothetical protein